MLLATRDPAPAVPVAAPGRPVDEGRVAPQCAQSIATSATPIAWTGHRGTSADYPKAPCQKEDCRSPIAAVGFCHGCAGWNGADRGRSGRDGRGGARTVEFRVSLAVEGLRATPG